MTLSKPLSGPASPRTPRCAAKPSAMRRFHACAALCSGSTAFIGCDSLTNASVSNHDLTGCAGEPRANRTFTTKNTQAHEELRGALVFFVVTLRTHRVPSPPLLDRRRCAPLANAGLLGEPACRN